MVCLLISCSVLGTASSSSPRTTCCGPLRNTSIQIASSSWRSARKKTSSSLWPHLARCTSSHLLPAAETPEAVSADPKICALRLYLESAFPGYTVSESTARKSEITFKIHGHDGVLPGQRQTDVSRDSRG